MTVSKSILRLFGLAVIATLSLAPSRAKASASAASPCDEGHGCVVCDATDEEGNACKVWWCNAGPLGTWEFGFECEE